MNCHLYVTSVPEALVASMLAPEEFGCYLAVGTRKRTRGQAVFFEVDPELKSDYFDLGALATRCVPHRTGEPKHSLYISIYRVFENVPLDAFRDLFLTTRDGKVLRLSQATYSAAGRDDLFLYKELGPVYPTIASRLDPASFVRFITDKSHPIWVPKIFFADLELGDIGREAKYDQSFNLPYRDVGHVRDCLAELLNSPAKQTKTVDRIPSFDFFYRTIREGFFLGEGDRMLWYRFPPKSELDRDHHEWWRSASLH